MECASGLFLPSPWLVEALGLILGIMWLQIWGFEEFDENRHYSRHIRFEKGEKTLLKKMVYDYFE